MAAPGIVAPPPGSGTNSGSSSAGSSSSGVSTRFIAVAGFIVAGGTLLLLADYAPQFATGTALLIGLGVALTHTAEINSLVNTWRGAIGL